MHERFRPKTKFTELNPQFRIHLLKRSKVEMTFYSQLYPFGFENGTGGISFILNSSWHFRASLAVGSKLPSKMGEGTNFFLFIKGYARVGAVSICYAFSHS